MRYAIKKGLPHVWRHAYQVVDEGPGWIGLAPVGGGFVARVPVDEVDLVRDIDIAPGYYRARFGLDGAADDTAVAGWTDGRSWNGWSEPLIERDEIPALCAAFDRVASQYGEDHAFRFAWIDGKLVVRVPACATGEDPDEYEIEPYKITVAPGDQRAVYNVGCGLVWSEIEEDEEAAS